MSADDDRGADETVSALERVGHRAGRIAGGLALVLLWIFALTSTLRGRAGSR